MMLRFHLTFPVSVDNVENIVFDRATGEMFVRNLIMIFDRIDCEKSTELYIDLEDKNQFFTDYATLEGLLSTRIGTYKFEETINNFIVANSIRPLNDSVVIDYTFPLLDCFQIIDTMFVELNNARVLNRTDFRHCEGHPLRIPDKSPLIGSINGFDNAASHLSCAIGDAKSGRKILVNVDETNQPFILRYEDENFNNQFHAYHIVRNVGGQYEIDVDEITLLNGSRKGIPRAMKLIHFRANH